MSIAFTGGHFCGLAAQRGPWPPHFLMFCRSQTSTHHTR